MSLRIHFFAHSAIIAAALTTCWVAPASADQKTYFRDNAPTAAQDPHSDVYDANTNPTGWRDLAGGNTSPHTVPVGGAIYFGFMNNENPEEKKTVQLKLNWINGTPGKFKNPKAVGHTSSGPVAGYVSSVGSKTSISAHWKECPAWEYITLANASNQPQSVTISTTVSGSPTTPAFCAEPTRESSGSLGDTLDTLALNDVQLTIPSELTDPIQLTQLAVFPMHLETNPGVPPLLDAEPFTGQWLSQFVTQSPLGDPMPQGGFLFQSDGQGLSEFDRYSLQFAMHGHADALYAMFAFDAISGLWYDFEIDLRDPPWYDSFDNHHAGDVLHDLRGWSGWDDDPAFDAPVQQSVHQSPPNAVRIADDADLVHPFQGADEGAWRFSAWQYIPSDFVSGGGGNFAGTYFNLLNTYEPGGPYHWSVQIQFNANNGLCRVFHGDGTDRVSIPYETDRWVEIQTIIDLEEDWTRVYYDDELITEYAWTGGVLGDGGGQLDIAAVDLYAQGSSPVYYDDLLLVPIESCRPDINNDHQLDFFDVQSFLSQFASQTFLADWNRDTVWDFFDVLGFLDAFAAGCP